MRDMKHYMNKFLTIAALLMLTTLGARAEQNVNIKVTPEGAGTVTYSITSGVCTLTVTPASGYYLTVENLSAVTTLNGGAMQTPSRRIDIDPGTTVEITATDASADPSKTTTYTFPMPENQDFDVEVTADFQTLIAINPSVELEGWTFGEQPNTPVVKGNLGNGAVTFTYQAEGATEFTETVPTAVGTHTVKASVAAAKQYKAGEATNTFIISAKAVTAAMIADIADQTYSGTPITPTLTVKDGETTLTLNTDYSVAYENNVNVGSATATITGKGNYTGTASKTFTIGKAAAAITKAPAAIDGLVYSGEAQALVEAGTVSAGTMVYSTTLTGTFSETIPTGTNAGTYTVYYMVNGNDNYNGIDASETNKVSVTIAKAAITEVTLEETSFTYTGSEQTATVSSVKAGELTLTATDYDVSGNKGTDKGTYTVTVTAKETSNFSGSKTADFTIGAKSVTSAMIADIADQTYTGAAITPTLTVTDGETTLTLNTDYTVAYSDNTNVGTATAIITGKGNYQGTTNKTFTITAKSIATGYTVSVDATQTYIYTGSEIKPTVMVTPADGGTALTLDTDYTVSYSNNINAALASDDLAPTVTVTGKGNYTGSASATFTIAKASATLSFSAESISTPVNVTPEWPELENPQKVNVIFSSSAPEVAEVDEATGEVKMNTPGTTTITAAVNDPNYQDAEANYVLEVTSYAYKLKIDGKVVTEENRNSLFDGSVMFNGVNRLYLTGAEIVGIESGLDSLEIYIKGTNVIVAENDKYAIRDLTPARTQNLRFLTDNTDPGSLQLLSENSIIFGFDTITVEKPLIVELPSSSSNGLELNSEYTYYAMIVVPLDPLVDGENKNKTIDYGDDPGGAGNGDLTNIIIDNVLYTLHDTQTPGVSDDGFYDGMVVLNSVVSDDDMQNALQLIPSTDDYANAFKGLTIMVPPGTGKIAIKLFTQEGHGICVNLGGLIKKVIQTHGKVLVDTIPYSCPIATYVYIYHVEIDGAAAANNSHRIGPKPTVTTGVNGLSVSADNVDTPPGAQADYLSLSRDDIMIPEGGAGHIIVENEKVTDLNGDAFGSMFDNEDMAPKRRAYGDYDITYIDLRGTSITGKEFSREEGPFKGLPETTFIYLPAGNIVSGKNMVVGSVCDSLLLGNDYYSFECAPGGFTATNAVLERSFEADKKKPFYVPFALSNHEDYGTFFEFDELKNGVLEMKKATTVAANTAYYLQAKEGGVENIEAQSVQVEPLEEEPYSGLIGTYMPIALFSDSYVYDNDLKQFRKGNIDYAAPFEVYLSIKSDESTLLTHWEGEPAPTVVEAVRTESAETNQWYSLDGRKLQEQPTRKGVYLRNSRKLVVK